MFIFMSKVTIETREGRKSTKGTTENEALQTAKRSRRVNKTGGQGKQAAEQLRSEKPVGREAKSSSISKKRVHCGLALN